MDLALKQRIEHLSKEEQFILRELCHIAKNLMNEAVHNARQCYFEEKKDLGYEKNYLLLKNGLNYKKLDTNVANGIIKEVDNLFKSFFKSLELEKKEEDSINNCRLPSYLSKDGFAALIIEPIELDENKITVPYSDTFKERYKPIKIKMPDVLIDKCIKKVRIIPRSKAKFFEIQYIYENQCLKESSNKNRALSIDLGINNLVTAVSNEGRSFIIDGRKLKSMNQWFNKENNRLQIIKDKQRIQEKMTKNQRALIEKRNRQIGDYMVKAAKKIIDYCILNEIGILVIGYDEAFLDVNSQDNSGFFNITYGQLYLRLEHLCKLNNIIFVKQEESYTSTASFWDKDEIPVYIADNNQESYSFSGERIKRGLYKTANGMLLNADLNGALNILKKSNVVSLDTLYGRGEVDTPVRIRIDK